MSDDTEARPYLKFLPPFRRSSTRIVDYTDAAQSVREAYQAGRRDRIAALEAQLAEAKALNAEMYAALKAVEWGGSGDHPLTAGEACCPSCGSFSDDHEEGCLLDAALAKAQGREVSDEG